MALTRLSLSNFKSFRHVSVQFGKFTVLIGANASGKSNFVQAIRFLRDIAQYGLANSVSLQGGIEYLSNIRLGTSEPSTFAFSSDVEFALLRESTTPHIGMLIRSSDYSFALANAGHTYDVVQDAVILHIAFAEF